MSQQIESKKSYNNVWIIFFTFITTGFVVGASVFLWQSVINNSTQNKLYNEIENLENQIRILTQTNIDIKKKSSNNQDETKEEIKKNEYQFDFNNTYFSPKYNITLQYNKDVPYNDLESMLYEDVNVIKILIPVKQKNQNLIDCDDYTEDINCYEFYNIKYFEKTNKLTIFENNFEDIEEAITDLISKEGGDMKNCNLQIEDYGDNKKATLRLSDSLAPTEKEVEEWAKIHHGGGDDNGAYSHKQLMQAEKSKKLCSKFVKGDMPYVSFFIFNENRKDIFVYFEFNFASENEYIDPESIRFLN